MIFLLTALVSAAVVRARSDNAFGWIRSMQERAAELGGQLAVSARLPHGTLVRASLPLVPAVP